MISVASLKKHLRIEHITTDDAYLADLEAAAVAFVERETGRYFGSVGARTEYVTGLGTDTMWLRESPILSTPIVAGDMTVLERADPGDPGTAIVVATDFVVRGSRLVRIDDVWTRGYEYQVTYNAGNAAGAVGEEIQNAVRSLVALWYTHRTQSEERTAGEQAIKATLPFNPVLA